MEVMQLVKALQGYERRKKLLDPVRYTEMDLFRREMPEDFKRMMPGGGPTEDGDKPPMGPPGAEAAKKAKVLRSYLEGGKADDATMLELFGFNNAQLEAALKEADPVIKPIPKGSILLTFDDSTLDHYTVACPMLEKYGFHANLFTTEMAPGGMMNSPGFQDKSVYMTWEQIKELSDRGHEICNHSWHHTMDFQEGGVEYQTEEILKIEERCAQYGIPKPITFGAPGGGYTIEIEQLVHDLGYLWSRGDMRDPKASPCMVGDAPYDPYLDTPLIVPGANVNTTEELAELLNTCEGKVPLMVFHGIDDPRMPGIPFADVLKTIADVGGKAITFRELSEYVDPVKAYAYTH